MTEIKVLDKFVQNAIATYNYDKTLELALRNPSLPVAKNEFISLFFNSPNSIKLFRGLFMELNGNVWADFNELKIQLLDLNQKQLSALNASVQDIQPTITPQQVIIALGFKYLRENILNLTGFFTIYKKTPLTYDYTLISDEVKGDSIERRTVVEGFQKASLDMGDVKTFAIYRNGDEEVVRTDNSDSFIYSQANIYRREGAAPWFHSAAAHLGYYDQKSFTSVYGNPSSEEIVVKVGNAKKIVADVLTAETIFDFELADATIVGLLKSLKKVSDIVISDSESLGSMDFEAVFRMKMNHQLGLVLSEGTHEQPKNSVEVPIDGFFAMLQVAQNLERNKFSVKKVGDKFAIDFSFIHEKESGNWVVENGKPVLKTEKTVELIPAYFLFTNEQYGGSLTAVFFADEPNYVISSKKVLKKEDAIEPLSTLPMSILRRSVILNNRAIVLDSLFQWAQIRENFYENALLIAENHVNKYTKIHTNKVTGEKFRKYNQDIFEKTKKVVQSIKNIDSESVIERYVWSIEQKFWDLNPTFDIKRVFNFFLGQGISTDSRNSNPYRLLCARLLGIDFYANYEALVLEALIDDESEVFIDAKYLLENPIYTNLLAQKQAENIYLFTDSVRSKSEFLRSNLYVLKSAVKSEEFEFFLRAIGVVNTKKVIQNHLNCIEQYMASEVKFHFEKNSKDYEILVRNKSLSKVYKSATSGEYIVDSPVEGSGVANIDYERRRIVLPQNNIAIADESKINRLPSTSFFPEDFIWGKDGQYSKLSGAELVEMLYIRQVPAVEAKISMMKAGIPLSNADLGETEDVFTEFVQLPLKKNLMLRGKTGKLEYKQQINGNQLFLNPKSAEYLSEKGIYNLGRIPTKKSLWIFQEPFLWEDYNYILAQLKRVKLIAEEEPYVPLSIAEIIVDKLEAEYNKLSTKAQIVADELISLNAALSDKSEEIQDSFNKNFNNLPNKAAKGYSDSPIFLEYSRVFGRGKFEFNFRPAQLQGLRFLNGNGNSGILAHEVGFGKTTTAIAKISDLFLRGEASRVLVVAPTEEVYNKWFEEIRGGDFSVGVLGDKASVLPLGNLEFDALRGKPTGNDVVKKNDFGDYDGCLEYSKAQVLFIKNSSEIGKKMLKYLGGRGQRLINPIKKKEWDSVGANKTIPIYYDEAAPKRNLLTTPDYSNPPKWYGKGQPPFDSVVVGFTGRQSFYYDFLDGKIVKDSVASSIELLGSEKRLSESSLMGKLYREAKSLAPDITESEMENLFAYFIEIEAKYRVSLGRYKDGTSTWISSSPQSVYIGNSLNIPAFPTAYPSIGSIEPFEYVKKEDKLKFSGNYDSILNATKEVLTNYAMNLIAFIMSEGNKGSDKVPSYAGAVQLVPHIRRTLFSLGKAGLMNKFYSGYTVEQVLSDGSVFMIPETEILSALDPLRIEVETASADNKYQDKLKFEFVVDGKDIYLELANQNYASAAELEMTSEIAEVFNKFRSVSSAIGSLKQIAKKPRSIFVCLNTAVGKFKVPYGFCVDAALTLNDFPENETVVVSEKLESNIFSDKRMSFIKTASTAAIASNQLNAINISRFMFDALIVDEVHNFNRGFKKAPNLALRIATNKVALIHKRTTLQRLKEQKTALVAVQTFNAEAKYSIKSEVQNFGAICEYIKTISKNKYSSPNKVVHNLIFLSATPFTDDNFQAYTLFKFLDREKLAQVNFNSLAKFYRMFANEIYKIDINIRGDVGLFPVIDSYKNTYILSRVIGSFCDFAVSDIEIDKRRPKKIVIANTVSYPTNVGIEDSVFGGVIESIKDSRLNSFIPKSSVQKMMAKDASDYIVGRINQPIRSTREQLSASNAIYEDILDWKKKNKFADDESEAMKLILTELASFFTVKKSEKDGEKRTRYELTNLSDGERVEELLEGGLEIDPSNTELQKFVLSYEASEEDIIDVDDLNIDEQAAVGGASVSQQVAARTMQMAGVSALTLLSPYYVTNDKQGAKFKKGQNPYLPPLNFKNKKGDYVFESYENAKTFVENSPKIFYVCEAISNQIRYQKERNEKVSGSIVYSQYYKFSCHGHTFKLFDLMSIYILGKYPELFLADHLGRDLSSLSFDEKRNLFFVQIAGSQKAKDQVDRFNSGEAYVLFGTERIKEGVDLQKNSAFLYVLTVGYVPVTFMQLHGRMWRQGNPFKYCFVVNVLVKNSIDAFQYSKLDQKINAVKNMLESGVYDVNETQFDVDVNEIKLNLINDAEKLAELEYEQIKDSLATNVKIMQTQVDTLDVVRRDLGEVYPSYTNISTLAASIWNEFSEVYLLILASAKQEQQNKAIIQAAKNEVAERLFEQQFTSKQSGTEEAEKEFSVNYANYLMMKEERQKFTTAKWEENKSKKKWVDFLSIQNSLDIQKGISDNDPDVMAIANTNGMISLEDAKSMVLSDSRYKNLKSKVEADEKGYIPYAVYDEIQTNLDELTAKFISQEPDVKFIGKYNEYIAFVIQYKNGLLSEDEFTKGYVKARIPIFNALYIIYVLNAFENSPFGIGENMYEIDMDAYLEVYSKDAYLEVYSKDARNTQQQGTFFGRDVVYKKVSDYEAIPARKAALNFGRKIDEPVNNRTVSITMQGYERLLKGKGVNGEDLSVEDVPRLIMNFQAKISEGNDKLQKPAETKAELAQGFQSKLDELAAQKDEDINEKVSELSVLYPLIQRK